MSFVSGSTSGLKNSQILRIEKFATRRVPANVVITHELARSLTQLAFEINRQLGLLIDRRGRLQRIIVGDARSILYTSVDRLACRGWSSQGTQAGSHALEERALVTRRSY